MNGDRRSVLIIGSGVAALMAAVGLARRLPSLEVTRLETGVIDPVEDGFGACRPSIRTFHAALGIEEADVLAHTRASFRLGTLLSGWGGSGEFCRGHGLYGESLSGVAFHHLWLRAQVVGPVEPYDSFYLACRGMQLDPLLYRQALRQLGRAAGVREIEGTVASIERTEDGSYIRGLKLTDERLLESDLFVDAGGTATVRRALKSQWVDWGNALLVERLRLVPEGAPEPALYDRLIATHTGWQSANAIGYSSAHRNEAQSGDIVLRQGRLVDAWSGNCLAIGSAAVCLEPTAATGLHAVCRQIDRLIDCWPGHDARASAAEIDFFNRRTALESDRLRDFVQLPYLLNRRPEPFWRAAATGSVSGDLARDIALFQERGRVAVHDEDGFERDEWIATFIGLDVRPQRTDALAAEIPMARIQQHLARIRAGIRDEL
jgi:tryptophan halogenase